MSKEQAGPGFDRDIRTLFRSEDVNAMSFAFNLASYEDVRMNAEAIYQRLDDGNMPCDPPADRADRALSRVDRRRIAP